MQVFFTILLKHSGFLRILVKTCRFSSRSCQNLQVFFGFLLKLAGFPTFLPKLASFCNFFFILFSLVLKRVFSYSWQNFFQWFLSKLLTLFCFLAKTCSFYSVFWLKLEGFFCFLAKTCRFSFFLTKLGGYFFCQTCRFISCFSQNLQVHFTFWPKLSGLLHILSNSNFFFTKTFAYTISIFLLSGCFLVYFFFHNSSTYEKYVMFTCFEH